MRCRRLALLGLAAVATTACGGGGGGSAAVATTAPGATTSATVPGTVQAVGTCTEFAALISAAQKGTLGQSEVAKDAGILAQEAQKAASVSPAWQPLSVHASEVSLDAEGKGAAAGSAGDVAALKADCAKIPQSTVNAVNGGASSFSIKG